MAGFDSLNNLIAEYHLEAAGVVGGQLVDQSGFGNHLPLVVGTPQYAVRDGILMMNFDNSFYFEGDNVMLSGGSTVVVGCAHMVGNEGNLYPVNTSTIKAGLGNFDAIPPENVDADWFGSTYQVRALSFGQSRAVTLFDRTGVASPGGLWTNGQANLFAGCFDIATQTAIGARGSDAPASSAVASGVTTAREGALMRIGQVRQAAGYPAGVGYVSAIRLYFFNGNVFNHPDFTTARAAEIALWGL